MPPFIDDTLKEQSSLVGACIRQGSRYARNQAGADGMNGRHMIYLFAPECDIMLTFGIIMVHNLKVSNIQR